MSQLYARIFVQILDSSIAENFTLRHVFEDLLKLADHKTGIVDMTRPALARRLNIPLEMLNTYLGMLESEDPASRDPEYGGRRIERTDHHRDWGWRILNWDKYEKIRTRADVYFRVQHFRDKEVQEADEVFPKGFPVKLKDAVVHAGFIGCSEAFAEKAWIKASGRGGRDARDVPIRSFRHYLQTEWTYERERIAKQKAAENKRSSFI